MRASSPPQYTMLLSPPPEGSGAPPDLLRRLVPETRAAVSALGRVREYRIDDAVFRQGELHDGIYIIESGMVKSFYVSEDGRELTLGYWAAGHYVGAPQVFGGGRHAWSSTAVVDTRCLWLPGSKLRELAARYSDLALALIDALVHKSQCYCALMQLLATHSMRVRLARLLGMLAEAEFAGPKVISLSHAELAAMIGSTRQWVSQSLCRFEKEGWLERCEDGTYRVLNQDALHEVT